MVMQEIRSTQRAVAAQVVGAAKRPTQRRRLMQAVAAAPPGRLNIAVGAGDVDLPGWINTDVHWRAERYLDITQSWPMNGVDLVFADNVIEHLPLPAGRLAFARILEALKPGGVVRFATPDLESTARAYLERSTLAEEHLERHRKVGYDVWHLADLLRVTFVYHGHDKGYIYDEESLRAELVDAGFVDVRRWTAGESDVDALRGLEKRLGPTEAATELILEATKPG
jgi:predicted SAM-dependent methyltransferase